jgi:hypothetical protein
MNIEYKTDDYKTIKILNSHDILWDSEMVTIPGQQLDFSKYEPGLYILEFVKPSGETKRVKVINQK